MSGFDKARLILIGRHWAAPVASIIIVILLIWAWNRAHSAESALERQLEEARLEKADILHGHEVTSKNMGAALDSAVKSNEALGRELDRVRGVVKAQTVQLEKLRTGSVKATGKAREVAQPAGKVAILAPPCLLAEGDTGEVVVDRVEKRTEEGNLVITGTAMCYRMNPPPVTPIMGGLFSAKLSDVKHLEQPQPLRWGVGVQAILVKDGWGLGPAVAFPPWRIGSGQIELVLGGALGANGVWGLSAVPLYRW